MAELQPGAKGSRRRNWIAFVIVSVLVGAGAALWFYTQPAGDKPGGGRERAAGGPGGFGGGRPQPVSVAEVKQTAMPIWVQAIGTVVASNMVTVRSRVDGELIKVHFREGQAVKAGELLAEIDPRSFEVQVAQAGGQLARDQALLQNAEVDLQRYRDLWAKDAIARQQLDTQEALVRQYRGTVEVDKGALDNARLQLSYTRIVAPISGRVGLRLVDPGNHVRSGDAGGLVTIARLQPVMVVFAVPESQLPAVTKRLAGGNPPRVEAWDRELKNVLASGALLTTDNQIDSATGTIKLKAEFANNDNVLFPNQFVNARLLLGRQEDALVVPVSSIQRGANGTFVYVLDAESNVASVPVTPGAVDGERVAVEGKLKAGDRVVIDGGDRLRPNAKVEVVTSPRGGDKAERGPNAGMNGGRGEATSPAAAGAPPPAKSDKPAAAAAAVAPPATPAPAAQPAAPGAAPASSGSGERPAWFDRLPPEIQEKLAKMTPEERREWVRKRREERQRAAE